jgi:threonine/homoserine/homoserine lactone efflux protein
MTLQSTFAFALAMLALAASPGPGVFAATAQALAGGFRSAAGVIAGIVIGDLIFLMLAVFGMSALANALGGLFVVVKIAGGAYLIVMGIRLWTARPGPPEPGAAIAGRSARRRVLGGLFITLSNPKVIVFYCGFLPTFMDLTRLTSADVTVAAGVVAAVLSGVLGLYAYGAARARRFFAGKSATRRFNRAAGTVLIGTGVVIASR